MLSSSSSVFFERSPVPASFGTSRITDICQHVLNSYESMKVVIDAGDTYAEELR